MKFPKGKPVLENVKIHFVNFDNILNQAKKAREGRLNGYIQIIYPQEVDLLFFQNGNPINAGRFNRTGYSLVPIKDVVERAKKSEVGIVNIYDVPDELLYMMVVSLKETPLFANKPIKLLDIDKLLDRLKGVNFAGFLVLTKNFEYFYVKFKEGEPVRIYVAGKGVSSINREIFKKFLEKGGNNFYVSGYQGKTQIKQADPALVGMYVKFLNSLIGAFSEAIGPSIVRKTLMSSYEVAKNQHSLLNNFQIGDDLKVIEGTVAVTAEEVTNAFATWVDKFVDAIFVVLGRGTDEIIYKCIRDYRFALKSAGFFEKSKLSRLAI
ncbi:hypothetical protein DRQ17_02320 [bacterium]|nr:MAG: hypothetical protein DRQ17_02320 [bacterium]